MSTLDISLEDIFFATFSCEAVFTPLSTPYADGTKLIPTRIRSVPIGSDGMASVSIRFGAYSVEFRQNGFSIGGTYLISVPDDDSVHQFTDLINAGIQFPTPALASYAVNAAGIGITDLVGGGSTNLDGYATAGLGSLLFWVDSEVYGYGLWEKIASTHVTNVEGGWLRPLDYDDSTNPFVWKRRQ